MTHNGDSVTPNGENSGSQSVRETENIQIYLRQQVDELRRRTYDLSYYTENSEDVEINPAQCAYLVFSFEHVSDDLSNNKSQPFPVFKAYQHNIILFHHRNVYTEWRKGFCKKLVCVRLDTGFLSRYIPTHQQVFKTFNACLLGQKPAMLSLTHMSLTPQIVNLIDEIITCRHKGSFKRSFQEAKVIELLILQLEQYEAQVTATETAQLANDNIAKMNQVKEILINDINTGLSLRELAQLVGTNEYDLKKNFKKHFGNTVFGYLKDLRMETSKSMLLDGKAKIAEVAGNLGYRHATHFTSAFKKHFGYLPNKLRLLIMIAINCTQDLTAIWETYCI